MATAFAVFCATDGSLTFYNRDSVPSVGDMFEGKVASNVYTILNTMYITINSKQKIPWYNERSSIISVSFMPEFSTFYPISTAYWFQGASNMVSFNSTNLNTSKVVDMSEMFESCTTIQSLNLSNFDTSNVESMSSMFQFCYALSSLDLSSFNTSKVFSFGSMFDYCYSLTSLDLNNFDTSNCGFFGTMFRSCQSLMSLDLSNFDTSNMYSAYEMFKNCSSLTSLDLSNFDTSKVETMRNMFYGCNKLTSLNLSSFNTSKVNDMEGMFRGCSKLTSLDLSSFDTNKVSVISNMFTNSSSLTTIYTSELWNTADVTNNTDVFNGCSNLVGAIVYDSSKIDGTYANYDSGYFTYKRHIKLKDMRIKNTTLYNIADEIRILYGTEETMTPAVMTSQLGSANTEVDEQTDLIKQILEALGVKDIITFTIADTIYQAEEGMTWSEWVESEYNIEGWVVYDDIIALDPGGWTASFIIYSDYSFVKSTDEIVSDMMYYVSDGGQGSIQ